MLSSIDLGLGEIFADAGRRSAFFRGITKDEIASQIRSLRKERGLTQAQFAPLVDMKQSAVSRIEDADYAAWTLTTLFRVAEALNARWRVVLEPVEDAIKEYLYEDSGEQPTGAAANAAEEAALRPKLFPRPAAAILNDDDPRFDSGALQWK
jgi:transcriptional regulator with XRE-family HTH domain